MTRREDYLHIIHRILSIAENELVSQNKSSLQNGNIVWEDIANRILNICFSYNTINLNIERTNFPGIDLGNKENGIGIQVTSSNDLTKIKSTIETVLKNQVYLTFPNLKFFILGRKQKKYKLDNQSWKQYLQFDPKTDILDFDSILNYCKCAETKNLQILSEYLALELKFTNPPCPNFEKINAYLEQVRKENSHIMIIGLGQKLPIEKAWIQLQLIKKDDLLELDACKNDRGMILTAYHEYSTRQEDVYDVEAVLETKKNTAVLAGPGMGKSTLCKKLLLMAVRNGYRAIKVSLMDIAGYMRDELSFDEALRRAMVQSLEFNLDKEEMEGQFKFLFLDGLDECGDIKRKVAQEISTWSAGHPSVKITLTSRPIGYDFSYLQDFEYLQIQALNPDNLDSYVRRILEDLVPDQQESCMEWFEKQLEHREIKNLACRSPLLLGFLLQLSIKKKYFGKYRCELYEQILLEWLQGSSRENEKKISDSEFLRGIEIIAFYLLSNVNEMYQGAYAKSKIVEFVGTAFEEELGCRRLVGMQKAEICVDFWTERGILDRSYFNGEERYLFLHLNIGEYLAGRHIGQMTEKNKREWIVSHYHQSIWHEAIRMAIACEKELSIVGKLLDIEQSTRLPNGSIFLAAEGVGERQSKKVPQALYDKLLEYLQANNPYLAKKASEAMRQMEGKCINWHKEILLGLIQSEISWIHDAAYSVYLRIPVEDQDYEIIRNFMISYGKNPDRGYHRLAYDNMEETIKRLRTNEIDLPVINAVKYIFFDHCTVAGMNILQEYLEQIGEKEWATECYREKSSRFADIDFMGAFQRLRNSERMLIQALADIFGTTEVINPIEICPEYSKFAQVIDLMQMPITEIMVLQFDLNKNYCRPILHATCIAGGIQVERLKEELYWLLKNIDNTDKSMFYWMRRTLSIECVWERTKGLVPVAQILEGLCSNSDILGIPSVLIALSNSEAKGMKDGIRNLLFSANSHVIVRVNWVVPSLYKEDSMSLMLERLDRDDLPRYGELYDNLAKCNGQFSEDQWLRVIEQGLLSDEADVVQAVLKYLLSCLKENRHDNDREHLLYVIKLQFEFWLSKKVICTHCKSGAVLEESGFCPDCHVGGLLPLGLFMELLVAFQRCTKEELITFSGHKNSDMSIAAKTGLKLALELDFSFLDSCLDSLNSGRMPDYVFAAILDLPSPNLKDRKELILRLVNGEETVLALEFMKKLNKQEWLSEKDQKEYLEKMIGHPNSTLKAQAMACWLGDDTSYNLNKL